MELTVTGGLCPPRHAEPGPQLRPRRQRAAAVADAAVAAQPLRSSHSRGRSSHSSGRASHSHGRHSSCQPGTASRRPAPAPDLGGRHPRYPLRQQPRRGQAQVRAGPRRGHRLRPEHARGGRWGRLRRWSRHGPGVDRRRASNARAFSAGDGIRHGSEPAGTGQGTGGTGPNAVVLPLASGAPDAVGQQAAPSGAPVIPGPGTGHGHRDGHRDGHGDGTGGLPGGRPAASVAAAA